MTICSRCGRGEKKETTLNKVFQFEAGMKEGKLAEQKRILEIIEKDIMFFEDARDILLDLKRQGVGTGDCEKLFDKRVKELKQKITQEDTKK